MDLKDKVVIVTGAGSGIGAAIALEFAKEGSKVAIVGRHEQNLQSTAEKCSAIGNKALIIVADVANEGDAKRIIQTTVDSYGNIDVLVNNAGITRFGNLCEGDLLSAYDAVMSVNVRAVLHLSSLATPHLTETKGNVINISSIFSSKASGEPYLAYCTSKAALKHLTRCTAAELAPRGIRVNCVSPGPVITDLLNNSDFLQYDWDPLKQCTVFNRLVESEDVANLVTFLASGKAKSITGSDFVCDNGMLLK